MNRLFPIMASLLFAWTSCKQHPYDMNIKDNVDHWKISKTFMTYNHSSLLIDSVAKEYKIVHGHNQVLVVTVARKPIFKEGKELTDLYSTKSLLVELDAADKLVTAQAPGNSKLFLKLIAFSPDNGVKPLHSDERITLSRKDTVTWTVSSQIQDFEFNGEFNFWSDQVLVENFDDY